MFFETKFLATSQLSIRIHILFYRHLGCLAFSLRFWPKIKQLLSNCPASDLTFSSKTANFLLKGFFLTNLILHNTFYRTQSEHTKHTRCSRTRSSRDFCPYYIASEVNLYKYGMKQSVMDISKGLQTMIFNLLYWKLWVQMSARRISVSVAQ